MSSYTHRDVDISLIRNGETIAKGFAKSLRIDTRPTYHRHTRLDTKEVSMELLTEQWIVSWSEAYWDDEYDEDISTQQEYDIELDFDDGEEIKTYKNCKIETGALMDTEVSFQRNVTFACKSYEPGGS